MLCNPLVTQTYKILLIFRNYLQSFLKLFFLWRKKTLQFLFKMIFQKGL
jgi:hypothetical protein